MAAGETARLIATLELKDLFSKTLGSAEKQLGSFDTKLDKTQSRAYRAGQQIGTGIKRGTAIAIGAIGFLATNVALGVGSLEKLENVTTQTNAVLKSTKGVAGETADSIREMSNRFENLNATMDDTAIQSGANVLLTFTNIRKKAFEPALQAALNLSTAMGQDLQSSVVQIGKALNDPIKGITALTRVGVTFDAAQKKQIESLVKANKTYEAQKIIIAELDREFGGSFLGQGNTTAGKFAKVRDAVDDLQRSLATALLPALSKIADKARAFLTNPAVVAQVSKLGDSIAGLFSDENLAAAGDTLKSLFDTAKTAAPIIEASAKATLGFVQAAVGVFKSLPQPIQALIVGGFALNKLTGGLVTNLAGGILGAVKGARGQSPATPLYVADVTGGLGAAGGAGGVAGGVGGAAKTIIGATVVGAIIAEVGTQFTNKFDAELAARVDEARQGLRPIADIQKELTDALRGAQAGHLGQARIDFLQGLLTKLNAPGGLPVSVTNAATNNQTPGSILDRGGRESGFNVLAGKIRDDENFVRDAIRASREQTNSVVRAIKQANKPTDITKAVKGVLDRIVAQGRGSVGQTRAVIAALKHDLANAHDPKLQAALRDAIHKVEAKLPGRIYADRELAKADKIIHGTGSVADKIKGLQAIENDLKNHKLPGQTAQVKSKIDALKSSSKSAADRTTAAVKAKKLSITNNITIPVTTTINSRGVVAVVSRYDNYVSRSNKIAI